MNHEDTKAQRATKKTLCLFVSLCLCGELLLDKRNGHVTGSWPSNNARRFYHRNHRFDLCNSINRPFLLLVIRSLPMKHFISLISLISFTSLIIPTQPLAAQSELVTNGGFESFDGAGLGAGWTRWWEEIPNPGDGSLNYAGRPDWSPESNPTFVQSGGQSQHVGANWNPWHAGVFQTLTASPGAKIRLTAYGRVFASTPDFPNPSDTLVQARMQIGADPNGGTQWWSGDAQWSSAGSPHDTWQAFALEVTAGASGKVTLFLSVNYKGDSRYHLDAWWDSVSAQVIGSEPTPTATLAPVLSSPLPTTAPSPTTPSVAATDLPASPTSPISPSSPEAPTLAPTPTPILPGSACVTVYDDANGNGQPDAGEALIAGGQIKVEGAAAADYITDGFTEPHCFAALPGGQYTFSLTLPAGYFPTTGNALTVNIQPGARAEVQFGAQSSRVTQTQSMPTGEDDSSVIVVAVIVAVVLLLAIAGAVGVVVWQMKRS